MAVTIQNRPIKEITDSNGDVRLNSLYSASGGVLPTEYDVSNDLFPFNYDDPDISIIGVSDDQGRLYVNFSTVNYNNIKAQDRFQAGGWITVDNYINGVRTNFIGQVVSFDDVGERILTTIPYDGIFLVGSAINRFNWYAKDYDVLFNVYVGLNPSHPEYANQPNQFIAQKSVGAFLINNAQSRNDGVINITGLIKNTINQYFADISESTINLNQYTQFRVEYAEVYKLLNSQGENELYDGTNFQSDWILNQPTFTPDDFNCSAAALQNEDFNTDLNNWTNDEPAQPQFIWDSGAAQVTLQPPLTDFVSSNLSQDFTYTTNAYYNLEYQVEFDYAISFEIYLYGATQEWLISRKTETVSPFTFPFSPFHMTESPFSNPEEPIGIKFRVINRDNFVNVVRVNYFRQEQANEGCLPYLDSVYAVRQFRSLFGGSMGDYEGTLESRGRFLLSKEIVTLNPNDVNPEISLIANSQVLNVSEINVYATVTYNNGDTSTHYAAAVNNGEGLYRLSLNPINAAIQSYASANNTSFQSGFIQAVSYEESILIDFDFGTFENCLCPSDTINPDSIGDVTVDTENTEDPRTGTKSAKITNTVDFTDVDSTWGRFAHGNLYNDGGTQQRRGVWNNLQADNVDDFWDGSMYFTKNGALYTSSTNQILANTNGSAFYGCFSPYSLENYEISGTMFSTSAIDDDVLSYIIAFYTDGGSVEHTLSLCATTGGFNFGVNPSYVPGNQFTNVFDVLGGGSKSNCKWALVYNHGKADAKVLLEEVTGASPRNWDTGGELDFEVVRMGDDINIVVNWEIDSINYSQTWNFDLSSDVDTTKFIGAQPIGFAFNSQDLGGFKNVVFNNLGGGFKGTNLISLFAGENYTFRAFVNTGSYIAGNEGDSFLSIALFDDTDTIITTGVTSEKIYGNTNGYIPVTATYTPTVDQQVTFGVYKGGTSSTTGAQVVYIDDMSVNPNEIIIVDPVPIKYNALNRNCTELTIKWVNDLGGIEYHTFQGRKADNIEFQDNATYKREVRGNWDQEFINGGGIGYEQYILYNRMQTVSTLIIGTELKEKLSTIKTSINVKAYIEEIGDYVTVLCDKNSFNEKREGQTSYRFQFDIMYPDSYVQTA